MLKAQKASSTRRNSIPDAISSKKLSHLLRVCSQNNKPPDIPRLNIGVLCPMALRSSGLQNTAICKPGKAKPRPAF